MADGTIRRQGRVLLLSVPLGVGLIMADALPAVAQDRPRNVLEMLFGPPVGQAGPQAQPQPQVRRQQAQPRRQQAQPRRGNRQQAAPRRQGSSSSGQRAASAPPQVQEVAKAENARDVLVVGDFLAASLARGLTDVFAANKDVRVVGRANGSSGLVRDDFYDWVGSLPALMDETEPDLVVVMLGSNDRQAIRAGGSSHPVRSEAWTQEYTRRLTALAELVEARDVPLVWVGMPSFQSNRMTEDMVFFNDLYKRAAASVEGEFVDIWNGFVDANGAFITSGPDPAGQPARLRNSDGVSMAPAGAAKLAYYVEKPVVSRLGLSVDDLLVSLAPQQLPEGEIPAAEAAGAPDRVRTGPIALADPGLDGSDALAGGRPASSAGAGQSPRERLILAGAPPAAAPGRADSFNWSGKSEAVSPITRDNAIVSRGSTSLDALRAQQPSGEGNSGSEER